MRQLAIDDFVRVTRDMPELALIHGQVGVVRGQQPAPGFDSQDLVYEVEFHRVGHDYQAIEFLRPEQLEIEEGSLRPKL